MSGKEYPCFNIAQMAEIPDEVLPSFMKELPALLRHVRNIKAAADDIGAEMKAKAPWPFRLLPISAFTATVKSGIARATFRDDKENTITLHARISDRHEAFYTRTETLDAGQ